MGTITQNLERLVEAKNAIAAAITAKGGTVSSGDGFEEFAADIATIPYDYDPGTGLVRFKEWDDSWTLENFQEKTNAVYLTANELPEDLHHQEAAGMWIIYNVNMSTSKFLIATYQSNGTYYSTTSGNIDYIKTQLGKVKLFFYFKDVS